MHFLHDTQISLSLSLSLSHAPRNAQVHETAKDDMVEVKRKTARMLELFQQQKRELEAKIEEQQRQVGLLFLVSSAGRCGRGMGMGGAAVVGLGVVPIRGL
jgi:hypothetical protein